MDLAGKDIAVLGAGGSGHAAAALGLSRGARVIVFDDGAPEKLVAARERFEALGATFHSGATALQPTGRFDLAVISPGIDLASPLAEAFAAISEEVVGEIEFAYRLSSVPVIAITGTNGKTTTTSLIATLIEASGARAIAAGNIGLAYSEVVRSGEAYDWIVLELSSFQLETVSTFAPHVAVWLNFAPDHMDRYRCVEDYQAAKMRLFERRGPDHLAVHKQECALGLDGRVATFSAFAEGADYVYRAGEIRHPASGRSFDFASGNLQGKHNAENVMAALAVADELGIAWDRVASAIRDFMAPPHRCEKVAVIDGVLYLNDSKSTNLHSLECALAGQDQPVVLIAGGKDKGLDFAELRELAGRMVREAICLGEIAGAIAEAWNGAVPCHVTKTLEEAVRLAASLARPGEIVLFSPGTSSFDMFSGYEARGIAFREAVQHLSEALPSA